MMIDNTASSVVCFKNGYSFINVPVELEDKGEKEIKQCNVGPLPSFAVHGTVGLEPDNADQVKILSVAQGEEEDQELVLPTEEDFSDAAILEANIGRSVKLSIVREESSGFGSSHTSEVQGIVKGIKGGTDRKLAILRTGKKSNVLIDCSKIVQIEISTGVFNFEEEGKNLVVRFKEKKESTGSHKATLSYLTRGLTWAPSYTLLLNQGSKTMKMEGKARLLCDLPFFKGGVVRDVSLVAGQPKMEFGNLSDPLASGVGAQDFINQLMNHGQTSPNSRYQPPPPPAMMNQTGFSFGASRNESAGLHDRLFGAAALSRQASSEDLEEGIKGGETVEDFYHYKLENVPLKHNQPLSMDFIKECKDLDYDDIYYLDLNKPVSRSFPSTSKGKQDADENDVEAIHAISFKNVSGQPLTTAPVSVLVKKTGQEDGETINENNFMVQGLMKLTPAGKSATVEITKAMDVEGKFMVETSKEMKTELVTEGSGSMGFLFTSGPKKKYADSVEKNGKVLVNNSKDEEIKCKIEYILYGNLETSKPEPTEKTERQQCNSHSLNPTTKYVWEIKVPAKESTEINFVFAVKQWN